MQKNRFFFLSLGFLGFKF
uniref:Uncharacterized protein n=1 Tax=Rhizophora mucronata TaxID=61149 RepID=A0A2P2NFL5_RHIMU